MDNPLGPATVVEIRPHVLFALEHEEDPIHGLREIGAKLLSEHVRVQGRPHGGNFLGRD